MPRNSLFLLLTESARAVDAHFPVFSCDTHAATAQTLAERARPGDAVLSKASRGMKL